MTLDLNAIKARAEAATKGPWIKHTPHEFADSWIEGARILPQYRTQVALRISEPHDAEFIAHAREDVPALVAEVERLRAIVDRVREFCSDPCTENCCEACNGQNEAYRQVLTILDAMEDQ